jgi:hypothetical protein
MKEELENRWDSLSSYYEGDLAAILLIQPTEEEIALYGIARAVEE